MDDNPYKESMERVQSARSMGRMFVVGFLLLALGEAVQIFVRFRSPSILSDMIAGPGTAGIRPSDVAEQFQRWTMISAIGGGVSLLGVALLLFAIWRQLTESATDRSKEA